MANPSLPVKSVGDQLTAAEVNSIVDSIKSKVDAIPGYNLLVGSEIAKLAGLPQWQTIQMALEGKQPLLTTGTGISITNGVISATGQATAIDATPTLNSPNAVQSGGVAAALAGKRATGAIPAADITETTAKRFVSDAEKAAWNAAGGGPVQASSIVQSPTHRFVSDAEKAAWNAGAGGSNTGFAVNNYSASEAAFWTVATHDVLGKPIDDTYVDGILFAKQGSTYYKRVVKDNRALATWFGVVANTGTDQYAALQGAIDKCILRGYDLQLPKGLITLSEGVVIRAANMAIAYVGFSLFGAGNSYILGTGIYMTDPTECAIYLQSAKGSRIKDIRFFGMNQGLRDFTGKDIENQKDNLVTNGCYNYETANHAAIAIDRFWHPEKQYKHPKKLAHYNQSVHQRAGSTNITIEDCYFTEWVIGISISGVGMQNGEHIHIMRPYFEKCRVSVSAGDAQNRTISIFGYLGWDKILYHFNTEEYGLGCPPTVYGFNVAGYTKWYCRLGAFYGNIMRTYGSGHTELMYGIGGCFTGRSCEIHFDGAQIYLTGSINDDNGNRLRQPNQIAQCAKFVMTNSLLTYYNSPQSWIGIAAHYVSIVNCELSAPIYVNFGKVKYEGWTVYQQIGKSMDQIVMTNTGVQNATVTNVNTAANTWQFTDGSGTVQVGNFVMVNPKTGGQLTSEFGDNRAYWVGAGTVVAKAGSLVTVGTLVYGIANGQNVDLYTTKMTEAVL